MSHAQTEVAVPTSATVRLFATAASTSWENTAKVRLLRHNERGKTNKPNQHKYFKANKN